MKAGYPLAVFVPTLGVRSETFIRRHMTDLLPGKTAIVARNRVCSNSSDVVEPALIWGETKGPLQNLSAWCRYLAGKQRLSPLESLLERYFRRYGVEVALSEYLDQSLRWIRFSKKQNIRFFAHAHGYDVSRVLRSRSMRSRYRQLEQVDGIITVSEYSKGRLVDIGLSADRIHVIPCGVEVSGAPPVRSERDEIRCLAVGRMVAKKAPLITLEAFRRALTVNPLLRLDYVGSGRFYAEARAFVRKNNLRDAVILHGAQSNEAVWRLMAGADIFLQHSRTDPVSGDEEGLPVAILEAMANGLPVVSTRHSGIPEAVIEGVTGFLVDEGDATGMGECIAELADDFELRVRCGLEGWHRAKDRFSWEMERNQLLSLLGLA